jgi:hypothetical protein
MAERTKSDVANGQPDIDFLLGFQLNFPIAAFPQILQMKIGPTGGGSDEM